MGARNRNRFKPQRTLLIHVKRISSLKNITDSLLRMQRENTLLLNETNPCVPYEDYVNCVIRVIMQSVRAMSSSYDVPAQLDYFVYRVFYTRRSLSYERAIL